jgi:hypothetical protein
MECDVSTTAGAQHTTPPFFRLACSVSGRHDHPRPSDRNPANLRIQQVRNPAGIHNPQQTPPPRNENSGLVWRIGCPQGKGLAKENFFEVGVSEVLNFINEQTLKL